MSKKSALKLFSVFIVVALCGLLTVGCGGTEEPAPAPEPAPETEGPSGPAALFDEKVTPKLASAEIDGDFMTVWAENFADHMREWSDGMYDLQVYGYGTLGSSRDIVEQAQIGIVEFVFSDHGWLSGFVPEAQVLALNYMWPKDRIGEVVEWVVKNGEFMEIFEESCRANGFVPLGLVYEGWQTVTSNRPVHTLDLFEGFKIRVMSSALLVEDYASYGGVPTPMSYGDVYSGLQMGQIDGQVNPIFAIRSMNFFEVQNYITQFWNEPFIGVPCVNMQYFDSLPDEVQQEMRDWWANAIVPSAEYIDARHEEDLEYMLEKRPEIEVYYLTEEETIPFKERALTVYDKFLEIGGPNAEPILETLMNDIENAKQALGIQ